MSSRSRRPAALARPSRTIPGGFTRHDRAGRARVGVAALLLAVLAFALFSPTAFNGFISLDDEKYITQDTHVRRGLTREGVVWALTSLENANWYPLRRLSHLVDVSLFGMWAGGHHLVSAAWHAGAAALLLLALHRFTGALWRSLAVAGLFAAHPLQVESVAWAAERSNVLAGFFFALTLLLWAGYARRPAPRRYLAALAASALGMAAKPILVTLPLVLLLLDFWPLGRLAPAGAPPWAVGRARLGRCLLEQAPIALLAALSGAAAAVAHQQYGALASLEAIPLNLRLGNAALSCWKYLGKLLWPSGLAVFYPHPGEALPVGAAAVAGILVLAVTAVTVLLARRLPWLCVGWLWYLAMLAPMSGVVQFSMQAMADRFFYLPGIGLFLALAWLVAERVPAARPRPTVIVPAAVAALAAFSLATLAQVRLWRDERILYAHTLAVTAGNWPIETSLGVALHRLGRREEAIEHYRAALRAHPYHQAYFNLGTALIEKGRHAEAVAALREALRLKPGFVAAQVNLGNALAALGRVDEAAAAYAEALRLQPVDALAHCNLGRVLLGRGRGAEALAHFQEAVRLEPGQADCRDDLVRLLGDLGRHAEAARVREAARQRRER